MQRQEESLQLAQLWVEMQAIENKLNATVLPSLQYLGVAQDNPELFDALEEGAKQISRHFTQFRLQASAVPK